MLSIQEIRQLQSKELHDELARATRELVQVRMDIQTGTSKESHKMKELRRYIARVKTVMNEDPAKYVVSKKEVAEKESVESTKETKKAAPKKATAKTSAKKAPAKKTTKATKK